MQAVEYSVKQEMEQNAELVMRIIFVTQMEFANLAVQFKDYKATE